MQSSGKQWVKITECLTVFDFEEMVIESLKLVYELSYQPA